MKTNALVRIIIYSIIIVLLSGILLAGIYSSDFGFINLKIGSDGIPGTERSSGSYPADKIKEIEIRWVSGSIDIQTDSVNTISFSETSAKDSKYKMTSKVSGDRLILQFSKDTNVSIGINTLPAKDLTVTIPDNWVGEQVIIESVSAEIRASGMNARTFDVETVSGKCNFNNCAVDSFKMDTVSGDVEYSGELNTLDCNGLSAKCSIEVFNQPRQIEMNTVSGDLNLTLPGNCGFTVDMDALSGKLSTEFETVTKNSTIVHGNGDCKVSVSGVSGKLQILKGSDGR